MTTAITASKITDSTATGRSIVTAADAAAVRTAAGATAVGQSVMLAAYPTVAGAIYEWRGASALPWTDTIGGISMAAAGGSNNPAVETAAVGGFARGLSHARKATATAAPSGNGRLTATGLSVNMGSGQSVTVLVRVRWDLLASTDVDQIIANLWNGTSGAGQRSMILGRAGAASGGASTGTVFAGIDSGGAFRNVLTPKVSPPYGGQPQLWGISYTDLSTLAVCVDGQTIVSATPSPAGYTLGTLTQLDIFNHPNYSSPAAAAVDWVVVVPSVVSAATQAAYAKQLGSF